MTLAVAVTAVVGYSAGPPDDACSTMTPGHFSNIATGPVPFTVNISSLDCGYLPGHNYTSDYVHVYSCVSVTCCLLIKS